MNNDIFLVLGFLLLIYYPIKYLILFLKYRTNKPSNDYDKRIFKESKDNTKKYLPLILILSLYFIYNYYPKNFFKIININEDKLIISSLSLGNSYGELSFDSISKTSSEYKEIIDLLNSVKYKKSFFTPDMSGTSMVELILGSNENYNSKNTYVSIRDGKYIQVSTFRNFNLTSYKYYKINKSINLSDEVFKILE